MLVEKTKVRKAEAARKTARIYRAEFQKGGSYTEKKLQKAAGVSLNPLLNANPSIYEIKLQRPGKEHAGSCKRRLPADPPRLGDIQGPTSKCGMLIKYPGPSAENLRGHAC